MELLRHALDVVLHLDAHLKVFIAQYGAWTYAALFAVVFAETGLVVAPFLPGDSLLFASGALAAGDGPLDVWTLAGVLVGAAVLGDSLNYWIGRGMGPRLDRGEGARLLNRKNLERTRAFFARHGGKSLVMARFVPVIRTFAPFTAGVAAMPYGRFLAFSVAGGVLWVGVCVGAGYFFGNLEIVQKNFSLVVLAIIAVSLAPAAVQVGLARWGGKREGGSGGPGAGV